MNHAVLNLRFREHCMDGCIETSQIICTCDKNILYAPIPQTIQYGRPELCALILADPHPQNIFAAIQIKADGNVYCFLYDLLFTMDMVVDCVQKNYGIDRFQMFAICSSSRIFALRAFSSGLRFFRDISFPPSGCFYFTPLRRLTQLSGWSLACNPFDRILKSE